MPRKSTRPPKYRLRFIRQRQIAYVTLFDVVTKKRQDHWLGSYGSPESRQAYARLLAGWEAAGRRLPNELHKQAKPPKGLTVTQLCHVFWETAQLRCRKGELHNFRQAIRVLRELYGESPAVVFGPNALRLVRQAMTMGNALADPPRPAWSRQTANRQAQRVRQIFRWAAAHELLPVTIHQALQTLEPLRYGHPGTYETEPVTPADPVLVAATLRHCGRHVAAMIGLQLLTGMRPSEICALRPADLDRGGEVWLYMPPHHKTRHKGRRRAIYLGPKAQQIIKPFLERPGTAYLFSPAEASAERRAARHALRKTPLSCGNAPGRYNAENPKCRPRDRYDSDSYRRAVQRAAMRAFPPPERLRREKGEDRKEWLERLGEPDRKELLAWEAAHAWFPYQLRHNYATEVRRQHGLEAAQILLGHSSALVTEAVYAERDQAKALKIAAEIG